MYVNYRQRVHGGRDFNVVMRAATPPAALLAYVRRIVHDLAPDVALRFQTFENVFSASLAARRFNLTLVVVFAMTALLLAAAGIYGVMSYWVTRRTHEIGIRMALGALPIDVVRLVLEEGLRTKIIGLMVGIVAAVALTRTMQSMLFEVSAIDPVTFVGVALIILVVALASCYMPVPQATKVDPMVALRHE